MSEAAVRPWPVEDFLTWQEGREGRYELVGGVPVKMMTGATARHDNIVLNVLAELRLRLRGRPCRPFSADFCVETLPGQIRRPDAGVDCDQVDPDALVAREPVLIVEVFSPSTRDFDRAAKLAEYKAVPSVRTILYVEPNRPEVYVFERGTADAWAESRVIGLDNSVGVPALGLDLPLAEIFDGIGFSERPGPV